MEILSGDDGIENNNQTPKIETENTQKPDISKAFNAPFVSRGIIKYFELSEEKVHQILEQYEKLGEPLLLSVPNANETDDERRDRELLKFALETGGSSKNFIRNSDGSLLDFDTFSLNQAILTGETTINNISQAKSIEDISKIIGPEITYKTIEKGQLSEEQIEKFDKKILSKEPLFNVTIVTGKDTVKPMNNVTKEMIDMWGKMNYEIFGQKQTSDYSIQYEVMKTSPTEDVLKMLSFGGRMGLNTFRNKMSERGDAVYGFQLDPKVSDFIDESSEIVRKARGLVGQEINPHLIKINFMLAPYLTEIDISNTGESMRRFGFNSEVPNSVIMSTINECQSIVNEAKEKESPTKQQEPEKPRNKFQKFFDNLRAKK